MALRDVLYEPDVRLISGLPLRGPGVLLWETGMAAIGLNISLPSSTEVILPFRSALISVQMFGAPHGELC